jgi:hypothetical protein
VIDDRLNDLFTHPGCECPDVIRYDRPSEFILGWKCQTCGWDTALHISDMKLEADSAETNRWLKLLVSAKGRQAIAMIANKCVAVWDEVELS